ncbi:MAG TPA: serine/threonine-protein kinase, partial [Candidatus Xenobia bacterium]
VKVLHRMGAEKAWLRFDREVRLCTRLSHPNIVAVLGSGLYRWGHNAWPFMVMERVEGLTLKKRFESYRTVDEVVGWMRQVLRGLSVAHAAGVVHRDLTPDNILITRDDVVKIMDFGVAFQVGEHDLTQTGQALGTPVYMSPEHLDAKGATPASDVYSVGVVFYQALSGAIPHDAPEVWGLLARKLSEPPADLGARCPELDPRLVSVVMRMLAADPANRYQTADQVLDALDRHTE